MEELMHKYLQQNPQYCVQNCRRQADKILDERYSTVLDYVYSNCCKQGQVSKFQDQLNLFNCVAQCDNNMNEQKCQVCDKDKSQYTCICGKRYCCLPCYKTHKNDGCSGKYD